MIRTRLLPAAALVTALVLTGCGGDPEPQIADPTGSSTPSADAQPGEDSEERIVESFVATVSAALASGDTASLLKMSDERCGNCSHLAENITLSFADGNRVEGASWRITSSRKTGANRFGSIWSVELATTEERNYDQTGELTNIVPAGTRRIELAILEDGDPAVRQFRVVS